jgi:hypothetical protein
MCTINVVIALLPAVIVDCSVRVIIVSTSRDNVLSSLSPFRRFGSVAFSLLHSDLVRALNFCIYFVESYQVHGTDRDLASIREY